MKARGTYRAHLLARLVRHHISDAVATRRSNICIVIPYFGRWPKWIELFFESCRWNPQIDWIILNDRQYARTLPRNVKVLRTRLPDFLARVQHVLGIGLEWSHPHKICDLRLACGHIFEELLQGYSHFGWGDLDVIYGDMRKHITEESLNHDCISFNDDHLSGHLCILRNTEPTRYLYKHFPDWRRRMESREYTRFDELHPGELPSVLSVYSRESFNTPLSPYVRWTDGTFDFPSEWYWRHGVLTNDKDGERDFLYLHFMHWKGGSWARQCGNAHWEKLDRLVHLRPGRCRMGFRINDRGFFPLRDHVTS